MGTEDEMTIGQIGHHIGLHVMVDLGEMEVGGIVPPAGTWVAGTVVGSSALGGAVTIQLHAPVGTERHGLLHRQTGRDMVSIDDPARIRPADHPATPAQAATSDGVPQEIVDLARAGKKTEAIARYRAINGATLNEAQSVINTL